MNSKSNEKKSSIKRIALFGLVLSLAAAFITGGSADADSDGSVDIILEGTVDYDFANEILRLVNAEREKAGLFQLSMNEECMKSANIRARECILRYSHRRPVSAGWTSLLSGYSHAGENLGIGYSDAKSVVKAWMESPTHRANIMGADFKSIGIGVFKYTNSLTGKTFYTCTQHFSNLGASGSENDGEITTEYAVTVDSDMYPVDFEIYLDNRDVSNEISMELEQTIAPVIKVSAEEIYKQDYITAQGKTLKWNSSNPDVAQVTSDGSIEAVGVGKTTIEAFTPNENYKTDLNVIVKKSIYKAKVNLVEPQLYSAKEIKPSVTVTEGKDTLVKGEDYKVRYSDNIYPGTAKIHVIGTGDYSGDQVIYFSIYDDSTVIKPGILDRILDFLGF